jgi:hypothetical protein
MRHILIALSLANLLFLRAWEKSRFGGFLNDFKPDEPSIAACVLLTAALLFAGWWLTRKSARGALIAKIVFLLLLLLPINSLRLFYQQALVDLYGNKYWWVTLLALAGFLCPIVIAGFRRRLGMRFLVRYGIVWVLLLAPFLIFTLGGVVLYEYRVMQAGRPMAATSQQQSKRKGSRVVWVIFDEMDNRVAFKERPASVSLPEFDRFRAEGFVAAEAYPPGNQTGQSVPALLNGSRVENQTPHSETRLSLWDEKSGQEVIWNRSMTIFAETAQEHIKTGLAGAYFPYCSILGISIDRCRDFRSFRANGSFPRRMRRAVLLALDAVPFTYRLWLRERQSKKEIEQWEYATEEGTQMASDPSLDFVYIHLPIPHPPGIYDRRAGRLDPGPGHSYLDNLALADVCLARIRRGMEQAGVWDTSTLIVTSDHWWRTYLWRGTVVWTAEDSQIAGTGAPEETVPYTVKLAGAKDGFTYTRAFNTVITRKLVMTVLNQGIGSNAELAQWLDQNAVGPVKPKLQLIETR